MFFVFVELVEKLVHCPMLKKGFTYSLVSLDLSFSLGKSFAGKGWVSLFDSETLSLVA